MGTDNGIGKSADTGALLDQVFELKHLHDRVLRSPPDLSGERIGALALTLGLVAGVIAIYAHIIAIATRLRLAFIELAPWITGLPATPNTSDYVNSVVGVAGMLGCVWAGLRSRRLANSVVIASYAIWLCSWIAAQVVARTWPSPWGLLIGMILALMAIGLIQLPKAPRPHDDAQKVIRIAADIRAVGKMRLLLHDAGFLVACCFMGACVSFLVGLSIEERPWTARIGDEPISVEVLHRDPGGYIVKRGPDQIEWIAASDVTRISAASPPASDSPLTE